jgi:predicted nucleic acid-binding protein
VIVVDASAIIEALLQTPAAAAVEERLLAEGLPPHAPQLIDVEVTRVLWRYAATRQIEPARCRDALDALQGFPLRRHQHDVLLPRVWELRHNLTAYDATYVALAEALDVTLLTRDRRVATAIGHRARVNLV